MKYSPIFFYDISNTGISRTSLILKPLSPRLCWIDYFVIIVYVLLGYMDLLGDILSIIELKKQGRTDIAALNIIFLLFGALLGILDTDMSVKSIFLNVTYLNPLTDGIETLRTGMQTAGLVGGKKTDAITRSLPSITLQLYILILDYKIISGDLYSYAVFASSIAFGVFGSAATLSGIHAKAGNHVISKRFGVLFLYYIFEILLRTLVVAIAFVTVGPYAIIAAFFDFWVRFMIVSGVDWCPTSFDHYVLSSTFLFLGSDAESGVAGVGSYLTSVEMWTFLIILLTLQTDDLHAMREGLEARNLVIICILTFISKTVLHLYIEGTEQGNQSWICLNPKFFEGFGIKYKGIGYPEVDEVSTTDVEEANFGIDILAQALS